MNPAIASRNRPWWHEPEPEIAGVVWGHLRALARCREKRVRQVARLVRMFERELWDDWTAGSRGALGADGESVPRGMPGAGYDDDRDRDPWSGGSYNAYRVNIDAMATRIIKAAPAVEVMLRNAQYEQMIQADDIDGFLDATINSEEADVALMLFCVTALNTGIAFVMPVVQDGRVRFIHLPEQEVWWDPTDARGGYPRSLHVTTVVSRSELLGELEQRDLPSRRKAELRRAIEKLPPSDCPTGPYANRDVLLPYDQDLDATFGASARTADLLHKVTSWHLPGYVGADDGRWVETIHGGGAVTDGSGDRRVAGGAHVTVRHEEWEHDTHPVVWWSPGTVYQGMYSPAPGHIQAPFQRSLDRMFTAIDEDLSEYGRGTLLTWGDHTDDVVERFRDARVCHLPMPGPAPNMQKPYDFVHQQAVNPQQLDWFRETDSLMASAIGANAPAMSGGSNLGPYASGIAQIVELDRGDERLSIPTKRLGEARMRLAIEVLNACDRAAKYDASFAVQVFGRGGESRQFSWRELDLPRATYDLQMSRVGSLSRDKSGRLQRLLEMAQGGALPQEDAMAEISTHADIARVVSLSMAPRRLVEWQIAGLSRQGRKDYEKFYPVADQDLAMAIRLGMLVKMNARRLEATEETIDRLTEYVAVAKELQRQEQAANAPAPPPAGGPAMPADPAMMPPEAGPPMDDAALMAEMGGGAMDTTL